MSIQERKTVSTAEGEEDRVRQEQDAQFRTIDWFRAKNEDRRTRRNKKYLGGKWSRLSFWAYSSQGWVLVFVIGLITGVIAAWVDNVSEWFFDIREGICQPWFWLSRRSCCPFSQHDDCPQWKKYSTIISINGYHYVADLFMYVAPGVLMGVLSAMLCQVLSKHAVGSGIPEIKVLLGGFQKKKVLGGWALLVKAVGSVLSVGSGLSLGKEGPFVHMASCIGNISSRLFSKYKRNQGKRREMISSSCAAGVAVAFGAPIGGVLFAHEEASSYFPHKTMWRSFFCAIVAAIVLQALNVQRTGKLVMFQVRYHHTWQWFEMPWFIGLGIMGGVVGAIFIRLNAKWCEFRSRSKLGRFPISEVFMVTLVSGILNFVINSYLKMSATSLLSLLFDECDDPRIEFEGMKPHSLCKTSFESHVVLDLFITGLVKLVLTIFTFGISVPAGLFIPSLAIGAAWGRIAGIFVLHHFNHCTAGEPCIVTGAYALIGGFAVLGGATRMTVSLVVIMFELTGGISFVLPTMVAVVVSKWVGDALSNKESIYETHVKLHDYPYLDNKNDLYDVIARAKEVMTTSILSFSRRGTSVAYIMHTLRHTNVQVFPILDEGGYVCGCIARDRIMRGLRHFFPEEEFMRPPPSSTPSSPMSSPSTDIPAITVETGVSSSRRRDGMDIEAGPRASEIRNPVSEEDFSRVMVIFMEEDVASPPIQHRALVEVNLSRFVNRFPVMTLVNTPLDQVYDLFSSLCLRSVIVVDRRGILAGLITKKDILRFVQSYKRPKRKDFRDKGREIGDDDQSPYYDIGNDDGGKSEMGGRRWRRKRGIPKDPSSLSSMSDLMDELGEHDEMSTPHIFDDDHDGEGSELTEETPLLRPKE